MSLEISYFFLFALVTVINGKPAEKRDVSLHIDSLKGLLNHQGSYDIDLSHHEDGPRTHHEDSIHISRHGETAQAYEASRENFGEQDNYLTLGDVDSLNQLLDGKPDSVIPSDINNVLYSTLSRDGNNCTKFSKCRNLNFLRDMIRNGYYEYVKVDELPKSRNELTKNFVNIGFYDSESRCEGKRCGRYRSNRNSNRSVRDYLRCIGNRCSLNDDRNINERDDLSIKSNIVFRSSRSREERDNLLCTGNRCGRNREGYNRDDTNNRICIGNRCGRDRGDFNKDDSNNLLCTGNKCGRNSENYIRDDTNIRILCIGNRCGRVRGDYNKDDSNNLLCTGNKCGKGEDYKRDNENNRILCIGNRCGRVRADYNKDDSNNLLCTGNKCGRKGEEYNRDDTNNRILCIGNRCGRVRADYNKDDSNNLRCTGDRCGRNRADYYRGNTNNLLCIGETCGRNRIGYNRYDAVQLRCSGKNCKKSSKYGDENVKSKELPKLYKEIDKVMSEIADIERFLKKTSVIRAK